MERWLIRPVEVDKFLREQQDLQAAAAQRRRQAQARKKTYLFTVPAECINGSIVELRFDEQGDGILVESWRQGVHTRKLAAIEINEGAIMPILEASKAEITSPKDICVALVPYIVVEMSGDGATMRFSGI